MNYSDKILSELGSLLNRIDDIEEAATRGFESKEQGMGLDPMELERYVEGVTNQLVYHFECQVPDSWERNMPGLREATLARILVYCKSVKSLLSSEAFAYAWICGAFRGKEEV